jgi:phosphoglycerol transferase MdoB-like AlkP superfamily enzyme
LQPLSPYSLKAMKINRFEQISKHPLWSELILVFLCALISESVSRASFYNALVWGATDPFRFIYLSYLLFIFFRVFQVFLSSYRISWLIGFSLIFLLSFINSVKSAVQNEPFFPWDILLYNEGRKVLNLRYFPFSAFDSVIIIGLIALVSFIALNLPRARFPIRTRLVTLAAFTLIIFSTIALKQPNPFYLWLTAGYYPWSQNLTIHKVGFLPTFLLNLPGVLISPPSGFSREKALEILSKYEKDDSRAKKKISEEPVNLIIFLAEGFWDATELKKIKFQKDPIPNFHRILKEQGNLDVVSPVLGGKTANAELELLTGLSLRFFPEGSLPYQQYIHRRIDSLASILSGYGYQTYAIHPYFKWFFSRDRIYPLLGFQHFISAEEMTHAQICGDYISDISLAREITKVADSSTGPFFIFAVSMENHSPYPPGRYEKNFEDSGFDEARKIIGKNKTEVLKTYITGIHNADLALGALMEHFRQSSRKTMIVFLGDHQPFLDINYKIYRAGGYLNPEDFFPKMYSKKAAVWTNYKTDKIQIPFPVSFNYVPSIILKKMEIPLPPFQEFIASMMPKYPVIHKNKFIPSDEIINYNIIQYDKVF